METLVSFDFIILLKLFLAMVLGVVLGIERVYAHKTAGMRTYALIAMASALFVIISQHMVEAYAAFDVDPLRVMSQVVVGVGFLGAGIIIFRDARIKNLTTASAIWIAAAIGVAVGFGMFITAIFGTLLTLFVLEVLAVFERKMKEQIEKKQTTITKVVEEKPEGKNEETK